MKKYLPYLLRIVVLLGALAWYKVHNSPDAIKEREGAFAYQDVNNIQSIVMQSTEGQKVELSRTADGWLVNGKYHARPDLIDRLMEAVTGMTSLAPVPGSAHDNVVRSMMNKNINVQLLDKNGKVLKNYLVGGATVDGENTYMLNIVDGKTAARPHMVYIPGFRGELMPRFEMDAEVWKDRVVFNNSGESINRLSVEYPRDEQQSFVISRVSEDSFEVNALEKQYTILLQNEQKYLWQYMDFYKAVSVEAFDNTYSGKDSLAGATPYAIITLTDTANKTTTVKLHYMPLSKRSKAQFDLKGKELTYDVDRYYAWIDKDGQKDFAIVQYYVFGKLLRSYKDFFFKPGSN